MVHKLTLTAAVLSLIVGTGAGWAQSLADADEPAEFPPASFTGSQYVDSRGCVYVRAGFDDAVTWVPRVSRNRQVLCGFTPTFANNTRAPEPEAEVATAPAATPPRTQTATTTSTPTVRTQTATPTVRTQVATPPPRTRTVTATPTPRTRTVTVTPQPRVVTTPTPRTTTTRCGATALSDRYLQTNSGLPVRCGPQRANPRDGASLGGVENYYRYRSDLAPVFAPPEGYRYAFDDDRLNPRRGPLSEQGNYDMRQIWDGGIPRQLVDNPRPRGMFARFFHAHHQPRAQDEFPMGRSETNGFTVSTKNLPATTSVASTPVQRVRSPSTTTTTTTTVQSGHRYVQVGTFMGDAEARNSAARLRAMGLPVRTGNYLKAGKTYRIVLAGPFNNATQLRRGLDAARRAGFSGAYTRR